MLKRYPNTPPKIEQLKNVEGRTRWSIMIPSYNSIKYLRDTLNSVLIQALSVEEMQIEVIDDCSTDGDVEKLVNEVGKGRISFYRHPKNIGHYRNFEFCINRAKGELIHVLHGDDVVLPGFYQEIDSLFNNHPNVGAAFTHCMYFDENSVVTWGTPKVADKAGIVEDFLIKSAETFLLQPTSAVVKRSVYEHLGTIYGAHYGEDWLMCMRIAAHYEVAYSPKSLANYRAYTNGNLTGAAFLSGQNIRGMRETIDAIQPLLPLSQRKILKKKAKRYYATYVTNTVVQQFYHEKNNPRVALMQSWGIFNFYPNLDTFYCWLKTSAKVLVRD